MHCATLQHPAGWRPLRLLLVCELLGCAEAKHAPMVLGASCWQANNVLCM